MSTVSTQFGVVWPTAFARALDGLSMLSFDFGVLAGAFCLAEFNFYQKMLFSTLFLLAVNCVLLLCLRKNGLFAAVYVALFAYPVVSVKIVRVFGCSEIIYAGGAAVAQALANISRADADYSADALSTKTFLQADYSLECYTPKWKAMAAYAGIWIVVYVVAFPLYIVHELFTCYYHQQQQQQQQLVITEATPSWVSVWVSHIVSTWLIFKRMRRNSNSEKKPKLSFLAEDYKTGLPTMLWEVEEMCRKLLLSVVGAFWGKSRCTIHTLYMHYTYTILTACISSSSTMCVATAVLISVAFQLLHTSYAPYTRKGLNRLQQLSLTVLSLTYFIGVLLKTQSIHSDDADRVGTLMVLLLVVVLASLIAAVAGEMRALRKWRKELQLARTTTTESSDFDPELQDHIIEESDLELGVILGEGAEGTVVKGTYHASEVAVKVTTLSLMTYAPLVKMLSDAQREAKTMVALLHPNIVQVYGVSIRYADIEVWVMTVLELCDCCVQDKLLSHKLYTQLSCKEKTLICSGIAHGMAYLHAKGLIHRDLKPANVLMTKDGKPKIAGMRVARRTHLCAIIPGIILTALSCACFLAAPSADFGLSMHSAHTKVSGNRSDDSVNDNHVRMLEMTSNVGTPAYMAPELMTDTNESRGGGTHIDVYSFGVVMYMVFSGGRPYEEIHGNMSLWSLRNAIIAGRRPRIENVSAATPPELVDLMTRCWAPSPHDRPRSFKEIIKTLAGITFDEGGETQGKYDFDEDNAVTMHENPMGNERDNGTGGEDEPLEAIQNPMHRPPSCIGFMQKAPPVNVRPSMAVRPSARPSSVL
jgi:serine/threonine protein kinase